MLHTDEQYLQHMEQEHYQGDVQASHADFLHDQDILQEEYENLPVIDMNTLDSSEETLSVQAGDKKENLNMTSVFLANQIIGAVKSGRIDPLAFVVKKKLLADALEMAMKDPEVKQMAIAEIEKYGKAGASAMGAKVTLTSRRTYTYSADPIWLGMTETIKDAQEKIKEQEKRIQAAVKNNASLVDNDTGELIAAIVPAPETTSIAVSFSKRK